MANKYSEAKGILLNNGSYQLLPVSKAQLIELANGQKGNFGSYVDVAGALDYLLYQDATNLETAKTYTGTSIAALAGSFDVPTGKVITQINTAGGEIADSTTTAYLNAGDIKRTATTADHEHGIYAINASDVEAALQELAAAIEVGGTGSVVTVEKQTTAEDNYAATYVVKQGSKQVGVKINIPKDFLVKSGEVKTATASDVTNSLYPGVVEGQKYLDFVVNTAADGDGTAETDQHIYIPVNDLVDVYTGTSWTSGNYGTSASVNNNNQISVELNAATLAALGKADTAIQDSDLAEVNSGKVAKTGKAENVSVTAGTELTELVGEGTTPTQVQAALELIAGKVNDLNSADYVRSVQGQAGTNDGVTLTFTNTDLQKNGAAVLAISHSLGNAALLHYDSKSTNDGISESFFNNVINS